MRRHEARDTGELLVSAGFRALPPDTPERAQQLRAMPPLKIVACTSVTSRRTRSTSVSPFRSRSPSRPPLWVQCSDFACEKW